MSKMGYFEKTVNGFWPSTIFTKCSILDVRNGSEYVSDSCTRWLRGETIIMSGKCFITKYEKCLKRAAKSLCKLVQSFYYKIVLCFITKRWKICCKVQYIGNLYRKQGHKWKLSTWLTRKRDTLNKANEKISNRNLQSIWKVANSVLSESDAKAYLNECLAQIFFVVFRDSI